MKKRIFAWVLLVGFVLLILNLLVFKIYWQLSMAVYVIVMFGFLLTNGNLRNSGGHFAQDDGDKPGDDSDEDDGNVQDAGRYLDDARILKDEGNSDAEVDKNNEENQE